jgi:hypothetical protein
MYAVVKETESAVNHYLFNRWHETLELAEAEAERLCKKERTRFIVLKIIKECYLDDLPVKWTIR